MQLIFVLKHTLTKKVDASRLRIHVRVGVLPRDVGEQVRLKLHVRLTFANLDRWLLLDSTVAVLCERVEQGSELAVSVHETLSLVGKLR